jgi:hypothetical protein
MRRLEIVRLLFERMESFEFRLTRQTGLVCQRLVQSADGCVAVTSIERFDDTSACKKCTIASTTGCKCNDRLATSAE